MYPTACTHLRRGEAGDEYAGARGEGGRALAALTTQAALAALAALVALAALLAALLTALARNDLIDVHSEERFVRDVVQIAPRGGGSSRRGSAGCGRHRRCRSRLVEKCLEALTHAGEGREARGRHVVKLREVGE